jgi:hypothetical protein
MSIWNPEPGDPYYAKDELADRQTWKHLLWLSLLDVLLLLCGFAMIAIVAFGLGYYRVF